MAGRTSCAFACGVIRRQTMQKFQITPNVGVGPIKLGMAKEEVCSIFGKPEFVNQERICFLSGFMVHFDENGFVEFIELARSNQFVATFEGLDLHAALAKDVIELVTKYDDFDKEDPEPGHSFIFQKLQLSLWRSVVPEDSEGTDGQYFEAVGIACNNYF